MQKHGGCVLCWDGGWFTTDVAAGEIMDGVYKSGRCLNMDGSGELYSSVLRPGASITTEYMYL